MCQEHKDQMQQNSSKFGLLAVLIIVVCAAVLSVHWPALSAKALSFDDQEYLTENVLVQNPSWNSVRRFLSEVTKPSTVGGYYQPLSMISLMTDYALGGRPDNLRLFHSTSLFLHAANTALIIVLLYLLFGRAWIAAAVGLLFGVHPMTVESIPWVGERKTLLAAFFALWCLILYVRYTRKGDWKLYVSSFLMYVLALMSKPTSLPIPVLMLLIDFWPLRRLRWQAVLEKLPFFVLGAVSAVITFVSQLRASGAILPGEYNPAYIPLILCHNIIFYLCKIIWPAKLSSHYEYPVPLDLSHPMVLAGVIGTCILIVLLVISLRWTKGLLAGWLFFFLAILPTMQIIGFSDVIASDKFAYLPSLGLLMILASFLSWLCRTGKPLIRLVIVVIIAITLAAAESVATRRYLAHWRDTVTLCEHMLALTPDAASVHNMLGIALQSQGKFDEAIEHYRYALQIRPDFAQAHNNAGCALRSQGKLNEAVSHFRQTLQLKPDSAEAHNNLGNTLFAQGKFEEAAGHYRKALLVIPDDANIHYNLANALKSQGKLSEAVEHYLYVLKVNPDDVEAHDKLGNVLAMMGEFNEAIGHFRQVLRLKPDHVRSLNGLAWILASNPDPKMRDANEAIALAERAAGLTKHQDAAILNTLASAYASAGEYQRAAATAQSALDLASAAKDEELAEHLRSQMELYRKQVKPALNR